MKKRKKLPSLIKYGVDLFRMVNACVILDQGSNRFSPTYAPLMDRLLLAKTTYNDVKLFNKRVLDGSSGLHANDCYDGRVIAFRNKVRLHNIFLPHIFKPFLQFMRPHRNA